MLIPYFGVAPPCGATDVSENMEGVCFVATPIFQRGREVVAASSSAAPDWSLVEEPTLKEAVDDVRRLCRDIMIACDFARVEPYPHLKVSFPEGTCGDGKGCRCLLTIELNEEPGER